MKLTRSYVLKIYPNFHKEEDLRYSAYRYGQYLQHFVTQLFYRPWLIHLSSKGMGDLANRAQREAMGIVAGERVVAHKIKRAAECPQIKFNSCPGKISRAKETGFDFWINLNSQWGNKVKIPANSHRRLNDKLRNGWILSEHCQFFKSKNGQWMIRVFVTRKFEKPKARKKLIGVDAGIAHGVTRSDGYLGPSLYPIIRLEKKKQADRFRQKHIKKPFKTILKQQLDREVNLALGRSKRDSLGIAVEHPKTLANLKMGKLGRWAKSHFANRLHDRALEEGVFVVYVNPSKTSITCSECGYTDKRSRVNQSTFECRGCGNTVHADLNAARNIALKGQERLRRLADKAPVNPLKMDSFEYPCWTNSHGAVSAVLEDGRQLGVKPDEFEIIEWYEKEVYHEIQED